MTSYIIATTPRCGGHYFCELLWNTGICGYPNEYFEYYRADGALPPAGMDEQRIRAEYFRSFMAGGWTSNGVFGAKLTWSQFVRFAEDLGGKPEPTDTEILQALAAQFGEIRYIYLRRREKLRQAISFYRATATRVWHKTAQTVSNRETIDFDAHAIEAIIHDIEENERRWESFLAEANAQFMTFFYEDVVQQDPRNTISAALDFLGIKEPWTYQPGKLLKQSDQTTEDFVIQYAKIKSEPRSQIGP